MSSGRAPWIIAIAIPAALWLALELLARRDPVRLVPKQPAAAVELKGLPGADTRATLEEANAVLARHHLNVASTQRLASLRDLPDAFRGVVGACAARSEARMELCRIEISGAPADLRAAVQDLGARGGAIVLGTEFELGSDFQQLSAKLWLWI